MEAAALSRSILPPEGELRAFAHVAAGLLADPAQRLPAQRAITRRPGPGLQVLDHRDYLAGDELRHVDWRLSARARRLIVRRHEAESGASWMILLDASASMRTGAGAKLQHAACMAAALAYTLLGLGRRVGLLAFDARVQAAVPGGHGARQYARMAAALAAQAQREPAPGSEPGACLAHLGGATSLALLTDGLPAEATARGLVALQVAGSTLHLLQLCDPRDCRWPGDARQAVVDVETGERLALPLGASAEPHARQAMAQGVQRLRRQCQATGAAFSAVEVATPWQRGLLDHLQRARARR